ncbi:TolC family protein [Fusibacter ferrireducens]|uniref:TolC family protein n=1 Tax=Fusibacter ferrireducens TaxID=2785058 RepID=A0ABR9ZXD5_9FIRM|nr:TolC family protein [Fusibacter ferrireducens]MBF4695117.1 TolC family protein [Fusibacter ferrireducens]
MRKIGSLLLIFTLLFQVAVFAESNEVAKVAPKLIQYEEAVKILIENSEALKTIEKKIEIQKKVVEEVEQESRRLKAYINQADEVLDRATKVFLDPIDARMTLTSLERSLEDKKFELKQSVLDYYVNWATIQNKFELYNEVAKTAQKEYDQKALELQLGKITSNDLLAYEIALDSAKKDIESAQREYDLALVNFNYLVMDSLDVVYGMDISNLETLLIGDYFDISKVDLDKLGEKNIAHDSTLVGLKETVERIEEKKTVDQLYSNSVTVLEDYNKSIEDNKHDTDAQIKAIKYKVYTDFYNLKSLSLSIKVAKNNVTLATSKLNVEKVKFDLGMTTALELIKLEKDVLSAEIGLTNALNSYYKAYHDFLRYY